ncbi:MAG: SHOCT domain-containing protein [Streptomycetaceae bacterium]|nr:SHOCT domain-containing protein [Streptomycetaceae bacterium]
MELGPVDCMVVKFPGNDFRGEIAPAPAAPARSAGFGDPTVDQLERPARLRDQGVLTDAGFAAQKARILGT